MATTLLQTIISDYLYNRSLNYLCDEYATAYEDEEKRRNN